MIRAVLLAFAFAGAAQAQTPAIPRTPDGHPDFTGLWAADFLPGMAERFPGATTLEVGTEEKDALLKAFHERRRANFPAVYDPDEDRVEMRLPQVGGKWRTSLITEPPDGKAPLTPEGRKMVEESRAQGRDNAQGLAPADGPEQLRLSDRCLSFSPPPYSGHPIEMVRQVVQTSGYLMIHSEYMSEARIIGIGVEHRPAILVSFDGDSTARWEGDVLVIETTNVRAATGRARTAGVIVRPESKIIEKLSFISADELLYRFTIEDPGVYSRPWSAEYGMQRSTARRYEGACHENNYSAPGILRGARVMDERAAKASKAKDKP